jgi:hypothetical protein
LGSFRVSSYEKREALNKSTIRFFAPDRVKPISRSRPLPGEVHFSLQGSASPFAENTISTPASAHGLKNSENANSLEDSTEDHLSNVFGPEVAAWLREKFPALR